MKEDQNCAEVIDLMNTRVAIGLLIASLIYALDAVEMLVAGELQTTLHWLGFIASLTTVLWILRAMMPVFRKKIKKGFIKHQEPESFITEAFHKAINKSWIFTLLCLILLKTMDQLIVKLDLPTGFYFSTLTFMMLFTASVIFLFSTWINESVDRNEELT